MVFSPTALCFLILQKKRNIKHLSIYQKLFGVYEHIDGYSYNVCQ